MPAFLLDLAFALAITASGIVMGWWLHRRVRSPAAAGDEPQIAREVLGRLQELAYHMAANVGQHASRVEEINQELTLANGRAPEAVVSVVAKLIDANHDMQQQLSTVEHKLHEQALLVELRAAEARTDVLTGLANRRALDVELGRLSAESEHGGKPFCLLLGDIDHFKQFNDRYGHPAGDGVLRSLAGVLQQSARGGDLVARYGGEEFAVVLPETSLAEAVECVERIRRAVAESRFRWGAEEFHVTISFGAAEMLAGEEAAGLLRRADMALYAAKDAGRNRSAWHDGRAICGLEEVAAAPPDTLPDGPATPPAAGIAARSGDRPQQESGARPQQEPAPRLTCTRHEFDQVLGRRMAEWRRGGAAPAVILARVDQFPALVARYGTEAGPLVLRGMRHFLEAAVREMDTAADYGEATFALVMPGVSPTDVTRVADRLCDAVARCGLPLRGDRLHFTISAAAAVVAAGDDAATLMRRAEEALAAAVQSGGNRACFTPSAA
jgi:diguanylate cyclase